MITTRINIKNENTHDFQYITLNCDKNFVVAFFNSQSEIDSN